LQQQVVQHLLLLGLCGAQVGLRLPQRGAPLVDEETLPHAHLSADFDQAIARCAGLWIEQVAAVLLVARKEFHAVPCRHFQPRIEELEVVLLIELLLVVVGRRYRIETAARTAHRGFAEFRSQGRLPRHRVVLQHHAHERFPRKHGGYLCGCGQHDKHAEREEVHSHLISPVLASACSSMYRSGGNPFTCRHSSYQIGTSLINAKPMHPPPTRKAVGHACSSFTGATRMRYFPFGLMKLSIATTSPPNVP
jgi:hypothetical protein